MKIVKHIPSAIISIILWVIIYTLLGWEGIVLFLVVFFLGLLAVAYSEMEIRKKL